eukprot:jgi/Hompol1/2555/HPOL_006047-RA
MQTKPLKSIDCTEQVFDLSLHPSRPLVAMGTIEGQILCFDYEDTDSTDNGDDHGDDGAAVSTTAKQLFNLGIHKHSCRSVDFSITGTDMGEY